METELIEYTDRYKDQVFDDLVPYRYYNKYTSGSILFKILGFLGIYQNRFFVLKNESDVVIGTVLIRGIISVKRLKKEWYIYGVAIKKAFRGKGYGDSLVLKTLDLVREMNISVVFLKVERENDIAIKLYSKYGFSINTERTRSDRDGNMVMELVARE